MTATLYAALVTEDGPSAASWRTFNYRPTLTQLGVSGRVLEWYVAIWEYTVEGWVLARVIGRKFQTPQRLGAD